MKSEQTEATVKTEQTDPAEQADAEDEEDIARRANSLKVLETIAKGVTSWPPRAIPPSDMSGTQRAIRRRVTPPEEL